jgi:histone H3/H4
MPGVFRRCSSCKRDIALGAKYWVCSVSTCNRSRTALAFCSTDCWDAHLGYVNHRESWAEERRAPRRTLVSPPRPAAATRPELPHEVLIVASKLKAYIRERSEMNTSDRVFEVLSDELRRLADQAIEEARRSERKTVLDRDFAAVLRVQRSG